MVDEEEDDDDHDVDDDDENDDEEDDVDDEHDEDDKDGLRVIKVSKSAKCMASLPIRGYIASERSCTWGSLKIGDLDWWCGGLNPWFL